MPAHAKTYIIYPGLFNSDDIYTFGVELSTLKSPDWMSNFSPQIHHESSYKLEKDVRSILFHAQTILNRYSLTRTKDVKILIIPSSPSDNNQQWGGVDAQWADTDHNFSTIMLDWCSTDLDSLKKVLTHELGHHIRGIETNTSLYQSIPLTTRIIQESSAERLVLQEHSLSDLHHNRPSSELIHSHLHDLLIKELNQIPLSSPDINIRNQLYNSNELYPAATHFMLNLSLSPNDIFKINIKDFLQQIIPLCNSLP